MRAFSVLICKLSILSRITGFNASSISNPILLRFVSKAAIVVVPSPKNGSSTISPCCEYMFIRRYGISIGKDALRSRVCELFIFCFTPFISHISENHTLRSSQKNELLRRIAFSESFLYSRLLPFLKISIHSCSKVT